LNIEIMREAARIFTGEHDFSAYCKAESLEIVKAKKFGAICEIYDTGVSRVNDCIEIKIHGNRFLHNMVRIIAGTLIYVSEGKLSIDDVKASLSGATRQTAGVTLPAGGLYLNKVFY